jgi:beta,beta-carotene 9',10'-dioxygenase
MPDTFPSTPSIETLAPFRRSPASPAAVRAQVEGTIPDWLRGEVVRTCPAVFETPGWHVQHWFDGLAMLYAFRIGDAGIAFRSRLHDCEAARAAWQGKASFGSFGTPAVRPLWQRLLQPVPRMTDNDNVNIVQMGPDLVALTEGSRQLVIDDATLAPAGPARYARDALGGALMTAHAHFDAARGKVVNVATSFGARDHLAARGTLSVYKHAPTNASAMSSSHGARRACRMSPPLA